MRILLLTGLLLTCLLFAGAAPALSAPDSCQVWRKTQKTYDRQEAEYWESFRTNMDAVFTRWQEDWRFWRNNGDVYSLEALDLDPLRELYAEYADIQAARVEADLEFAANGHERTAAMLLDALLDAAKETEKLEKQHAEARPVQFGAYYDQTPSLKLRGLAYRMDGLGQALAEAPGGVELLVGQGWGEAEKGDKKRSLLRRVALLDTLGYTSGDPQARAHLERMLDTPVPGLRLAAIENLAGLGADAIGVLVPRLEDVSQTVRRALLRAIRMRASDAAAWIPHVLETYPRTRGLLRARTLLTLQTLTGQALGDDLEAWRVWYDANRSAIEAGTWARPEPEVAEGEKEREEPVVLPGVAPATVFYGVGAPSRYPVFVVDGTERMDLPVDFETERQKSQRFWRRTTAWRKDYTDHHAILQAEMEGTLGALPDSARIALVYLNGSTPSRVPVLGAKKPLKPSKGTRKTVQKTIKKGRPNGTLSVEEGLRQAFAVSGIDPLEDPEPDDVQLDSVFVLDTGWNGGRCGLPKVLLEAFERKNRFYRLQVHTIRYSDLGEDAETLLKGLADVSEGTYLRLLRAP